MFAEVSLTAWGAALCAIDLRCMRLPNMLTLGGATVILGAAVAAGRAGSAVCGAVALSGLYLVVHLFARGGLGAGDVKLAIGLGALTGSLGADVWTIAALGAPLLTAIGGLALAARGRRGPVPHGPSMVLASLTVAALVAP